MKILHLSTNDIQGGAARAAYRLHAGLLSIGADSRMLVFGKHGSDSRVASAGPKTGLLGNSMRGLVRKGFVQANGADKAGTLLSFAHSGRDVLGHPWIHEADVINLHWINDLLTLEDLEALLKSGKKIVWTLHDQWPFTGGCHYTGECRAYETQCIQCPQLKADPWGIIPSQFHDKLSLWSPNELTVVAPSLWLHQCARQSQIFRAQRHAVIPYGIDLEAWSPSHGTAVRHQLKLSAETTVFLFLAEDGTERRKGWREFVDAWQLLAQARPELLEQCAVLKLGKGSTDGFPSGVSVIDLGTKNNDREIAAIYAASDFFVLPSLQDNLPNTILESLAAGTPVVGFPNGGIPDLVHPGETGILANAATANALADALELAVKKGKATFTKSCRQFAIDHLSLEKQARRYLKLYQQSFEKTPVASSHLRDEAESRVRFSVITVVKNAARSIERTILSVIGQTEKDFEYIVLDGQSEDGTLEILKKYETSLELTSKADAGIYPAMNEAICRARGEFILFMNADDWLHDSKVLERVSGILDQNEGIDAVLCDFVGVLPDGQIYRGTYPEVLDRDFFLSRGICHQALFVRRAAFAHVGLYDSKFTLYADFDWILKGLFEESLHLVRCATPTCFSTAGGAHSHPKNALRAYQEKIEILKFRTKGKEEKAFVLPAFSGILDTIKSVPDWPLNVVPETAGNATLPTPSKHSSLRLLQIRAQVGNYSETFLDDHTRFLSSETNTLYGFPLPHEIAGHGTVLEADDIAAIQRGSDESTKIEAYTTGLARWLKSENPEVVLAETSLMGARVWRACQRTGIPLVVHFHGADAFVRDLISQLKEEWTPMFEAAAALVVVSRAMEAQLLRLGAPHEKVLLLPYGVDTHLTSLADPANAPPTFLAVGRFVPKKAPHHTIRALRYLLEGKPDARVIMAGDGPMLEPCKQLAKEIGCDHAIEFRGAISREEVSRLMTEVRGFVQHSVIAENGDSEGLPLAILEAGAHGLPVVATRHAGIPDALRDNVDGVLVAEGDEKAMAKGMFRLLHHPETAERMGSSLRQRVCEKYDREGSMERLRGLLEGVAAARKPKPLEMALKKAQAAQAPHERMEALRHVIGLDRGIQTAYMAYAQCALETSQSRPALFALREADRLQPLPETMTAQFRQLENIDSALRSDLKIYNLRCGKVPVSPATKPRRILVFTNLLPPQELGGYGRTVWEFCDLLMQRGHEVRILTADVPAFAKPPEPDYERVEKCVSRALQLFGSWENGCAEPIDDIDEIKRRTLQNHRLILETAKAFQPDWCMAGNLDFVGSAILGDLLKNGWPVLHRLGNADPSYLPERTPNTPRYTIAGCSAWLEKVLEKREYALPRFDILHPGSPLEFYYKYFLPNPTPLRLCFAGLVMPYKGTQVLLEALALLQKKNIPFTCEIAGSSTDPEHYDGLRQRAAAAGLYPQIQFTGFQSKAELRALYARSNVLVFPSVFEEPFGKSQTEAMVAGLVVVTSGTGGASEIVEDGVSGLHFTPGSAEDLAAKLETLAQDPALTRRLQAAGQERAFRFTTLASVKRIETIAEELIATPRNQKVLV